MQHKKYETTIPHGNNSTGNTPPNFTTADLLEGPQKIVEETRPPQIKMAQAVEEAIKLEQNLVAEAGTGTGKSLAVLIPAILSGKRTVVSTATTLLQAQYVDGLSMLATKLGDFGYSVNFAVAKGKRHYLCPVMFKKNLKKLPRPRDEQEEEIQELFINWCRNGSGDKQDLDSEMNNNGGMVSPWYFSMVSAEECTGFKTCRFASKCSYARSRASVQHADIIIANHAIVGANLRCGKRILPQHQLYIIDEAHKAEEYFRNAFAAEISETTIPRLLHFLEDRDVVPADDSYDNLLADIKYASENLFAKVRGIELKNDKTIIEEKIIEDEVMLLYECLRAIFVPLKEEYQQLLERQPTIVDDLGMDPEDIVACEQALRRANAEGDLADVGSILPPLPVPEPALLMRGLSKIERLQNKLLEIVQSDTSSATSSVLYIEDTKHKKNRFKIVRVPVNIGARLAESLYPGLESTVHTSATIAVSGDFSFYKDAMGLESDTREFIADSPFNYRQQSVLYLPRNITPNPWHDSGCRDKKKGLEKYFTGLTDEIVRLVNASKGCAFVLFSARTEMDELYERVEKQIQWPCRIQARDTTAASLERWFTQTKNPVLFGTKSFWEGVSVEGKQLRMIIIPKIPFPPPGEPVMQIKQRRLEDAGVRPFMHLSFPSMVMDVKQGSGRLMRTMSDFGVVAILDARVIPGGRHARNYANTLLRALPFSTKVTSFETLLQLMNILERDFGPF